jgi:hypothetical protein
VISILRLIVLTLPWWALCALEYFVRVVLVAMLVWLLVKKIEKMTVHPPSAAID